VCRCLGKGKALGYLCKIESKQTRKEEEKGVKDAFNYVRSRNRKNHANGWESPSKINTKAGPINPGFPPQEGTGWKNSRWREKKIHMKQIREVVKGPGITGRVTLSKGKVVKLKL